MEKACACPRNGQSPTPQGRKLSLPRKTLNRKSHRASTEVMAKGCGKASKVDQNRKPTASATKEAKLAPNKRKTKKASVQKEKAKAAADKLGTTKKQRQKGKTVAGTEKVSADPVRRRGRVGSRKTAVTTPHRRTRKPSAGSRTGSTYSDLVISVVSGNRTVSPGRLVGEVQLCDTASHALSYEDSVEDRLERTLHGITLPSEQLQPGLESQIQLPLKEGVEPQVNEKVPVKFGHVAEQLQVRQQCWPWPEEQYEPRVGKRRLPQRGDQEQSQDFYSQQNQFQPTGEQVQPLLGNLFCPKLAERGACDGKCDVAAVSSGMARTNSRKRTRTPSVAKKQVGKTRTCKQSPVKERSLLKKVKLIHSPDLASLTAESPALPDVLPEGQAFKSATDAGGAHAGMPCMPVISDTADALPVGKGDSINSLEVEETAHVSRCDTPPHGDKVSVQVSAETSPSSMCLTALDGGMKLHYTSVDNTVPSLEDNPVLNTPEKENQLIAADDSSRVPLKVGKIKIQRSLQSKMIKLPNAGWSKADDSKLLAILEEVTGVKLNPRVVVADFANMRKTNVDLGKELLHAENKYPKIVKDAGFAAMLENNDFIPLFEPTYQVLPVMSDSPERVVAVRSSAIGSAAANTRQAGHPPIRLRRPRAGHTSEQPKLPLEPRRHVHQRRVTSSKLEADMSTASATVAPSRDAACETSVTPLSEEAVPSSGQCNMVADAPVVDSMGVTTLAGGTAGREHDMANPEGMASSSAQVRATCETDSVESNDSETVPLVSLSAAMSVQRTVELRHVEVGESANAMEVEEPFRRRSSTRNVILAMEKEKKAKSQDRNQWTSVGQPSIAAPLNSAAAPPPVHTRQQPKKCARQAGTKKVPLGKRAVDFLDEIPGEESFEPDYQEGDTESDGSTSESMEKQEGTNLGSTTADIDATFMIHKYLSSQTSTASHTEGPGSNCAEKTSVWSRLVPRTTSVSRRVVTAASSMTEAHGAQEDQCPGHDSEALPETTSQVSDCDAEQTKSTAEEDDSAPMECSSVDTRAEDNAHQQQMEVVAISSEVTESADDQHACNLSMNISTRKRCWRPALHSKRSSTSEGSKIMLNRHWGLNSCVPPPEGDRAPGSSQKVERSAEPECDSIDDTMDVPAAEMGDDGVTSTVGEALTGMAEVTTSKDAG